jgi:alanyl-tRNA synthetase
MTPNELRQAYLDFFANKKHAILPSAPLSKEGDPTSLFVGSGMEPLLPYFLGQPHPKGTRVVNSQKCFRTQDIEEVGDNRHTTFFEMIGNWSFGDYFKKEQLEWIFEFFTKTCNLDPQKLYVTAYEGNKELGIPRDEETAQIWKNLFAQKSIADERVFYYGNENWWSRVGEPANMPVGEPGGPDSEVFYDFGPELKDHENSSFADQSCHVNCDCGRYLEIGNNVFMTYVKTKQGFEELENKNIDFGGGLERTLAAMNNDPDEFKTEFFTPIINYLEKNSSQKYSSDSKTTEAFRIIADHIKAAVMLAADGVYPSNKEQGYFSRRLIRRAIRYGQMINLKEGFVSDLVPVIAEMYLDSYPNATEQVEKIQKIFEIEENKFKQALNKGLQVFKKEALTSLAGPLAFKLFESYGFPLEMSIEEAKQRGIGIEADIEDKFDQLKRTHAQESRAASIGSFRGGLQDQSDATTKYHTTTHLLQSALRKVLGKHVEQKGSNITGERLRFDFFHPQAVSPEELQQIEAQINTWIEADLSVTAQVMDKQAALDAGAIAFFVEKYPNEVTVFTIGQEAGENWISKELCGGPHIKKTSEIGRIKLYKEQSSGSGVRRVYARFE